MTHPTIATVEELDALPVGSVVMTETNPETSGVYEQRVWQKFGGEPDWQFGTPRHDWQSTDGGFVRVGNSTDALCMNRRVTILHRPDVDLLAQARAEERERIAALETPASAANWSGAWDEVLGYVQQAVEDAQGIENAHDLLMFMREAKRRHVTDPVRQVLGIARSEGGGA